MLFGRIWEWQQTNLRHFTLIALFSRWFIQFIFHQMLLFLSELSK
jgi:hypothetical protein